LEAVVRKFVCGAALAALLVSSTAAHAASITLTFGVGGTSGFTSGAINSALGPVAVAAGLDVTVSPWASVNSAAFWGVSANDEGFGVCSAQLLLCFEETHADSSSNTTEGLNFSFTAPVTLTNATFGAWGNNDVADIFAGGVLVSNNFGDNTGLYSGNHTSNNFFFQAVDSNSTSSWRLRSLTFDYTAPAPPQPLATPEPSSILLLGGGLIAAARRMRRRK
jgi:hypothetical protein